MARRKPSKGQAKPPRRGWRLGGVPLWRGVAIGVALVSGGALVVVAGAHLVDPSSAPIREVRVTGTIAHTDRADLKAAVGPQVQRGFFGVDVDAVRRALEARPWVRRASVRRVWPDALELRITERVAVARWGEAAVVDRRGEVFRPQTIPADLPRLRGPEGSAPALIVRRREFARRLAPLGLEIAALVEDERRAWRLVLDNGIEVRLGQRRIEQRLDRLVRVWGEHLAERAETIARIDLRYTNGLAVAWRDGAS